MCRIILFFILFILIIGCKTTKNNSGSIAIETTKTDSRDKLVVKQKSEDFKEDVESPKIAGYTFNIFFDAKEEFSIHNRARIKEIQKVLEENVFEKIELYGFTYRKNDLKKSKERIDKIHELLLTKKLSNAIIEKYPKGNTIQKYNSTKDDRVEIRMIPKK